MTKFLLALLISIFMLSPAYAKSLVVVFSRADENYSVGKIEKGNTMILAEYIADKTGSELFEIVPAKKYPADYKACTDLAQEELRINARPEIIGDKNLEEYDTIFLGYPIWWGDLPMCVYTFLEKHDFNGKTILPFATHEGSGMGRTESALKQNLPGATVYKGLAVRGSTAQNSADKAKKQIDDWLKRAKI